MEEFVVGFRKNRNFNYLAALYFTAEGGGAALILAALFSRRTDAVLAGLALVLIGVGALLLDLGRPKRFWRAIYKPERSWISRGALFVGGLVILTLLYAILPGIRQTVAGEFLRLLAALLCLPTIAYTGLLISSFTAVPAWNHSLTPQLFCFHSAATGLVAARLVFHLAGMGPPAASSLALVEILILAPAAAMTWFQYRAAANGGPAEQESARILTQGDMKHIYLFGAVLAGLMAPLLLALAAYFGSAESVWNSGPLLAVVFLARVGGDFCYRLSILKSGVYEPVLP